jgi:hypothetical protein
MVTGAVQRKWVVIVVIMKKGKRKGRLRRTAPGGIVVMRKDGFTMKNRKLLIIGILAALIPVGVFPQEQRFDFGRFSFSSSPKILKDGSITDLGLGYAYTDRLGGELRVRFSAESKNEAFDEDGVSDSLIAITKNAFTLFLMPVYFFFKSPNIRFQAGAGAYYQYETLAEKGYFNMPILEALGKEKVNSFSNNFSAHVLGPNFELSFTHSTSWLSLSIRGGVIPVFYLHTSQNMGIVPLMEPDFADYSQNTWGSPSAYGDIGFVLFKIVSFALLYDFSRLKYEGVDWDDNLKWYHPEKTIVSQSIKLESSLLIPLQSSMYAQIGYGHIFDSVRYDGDDPVKNERQYLIVAMDKKI